MFHDARNRRLKQREGPPGLMSCPGRHALRSEDVALIVLAVMTLFVLGGIAILWMAMSNRRAAREMEHRERLAMIQRGLIPSPELDPAAFEEALGDYSESTAADRWRTAGVTFIGLGLGLMMLIVFAAEEVAVGIGVGGGFAVLGATLLLNGVQSRRPAGGRYRMAPPRQPARPPYPPEPPSNVAP